MVKVSFLARFFAPTRPAPATPFAAGVAALDRHRIDEALTHFSAALAAAATPAQCAAVHNKRGIAYVRRGDRAAALDAFIDALTADERCVAAIVNLGNLLLEDGALDDAVVHYEAALRIDDGYAAAHQNLGVAYKKLGRRADAVREFRRANRLDLGARGRRGAR